MMRIPLLLALLFGGSFAAGQAVPLVNDNQVTICHRPGGTGTGQTMAVNLNALAGHLGHGDSLGACATAGTGSSVSSMSSVSSTGSSVSSVSSTGSSVSSMSSTGSSLSSSLISSSLGSLPPGNGIQYTICHRPGGTGTGQTITVSAAALFVHIAHGDTVGACTGTGSSVSSMSSMSSTGSSVSSMSSTGSSVSSSSLSSSLSSSVTSSVPSSVSSSSRSSVGLFAVTICHNPGSANQQTLVLPFRDALVHIAHGDTVGACTGSSMSSISSSSSSTTTTSASSVSVSSTSSSSSDDDDDDNNTGNGGNGNQNVRVRSNADTNVDVDVDADSRSNVNINQRSR